MKKYTFLLLVFMIACKSNVMHLADIDTRSYDIDYSAGKNDTIDQMIAPYKEVLDAKMNITIAYTPEDLTKDKPNSTLGSWFSDLLMDIANDIWDEPSDFAIQNYGGLRLNGIGAGDISIGTIYELMPFDNTLVQVTVDSSVVQAVLDIVAAYGGAPLSEEVSFLSMNDSAKNVMINGEPLKGNRLYKMVVNDYMANGGDGVEILIGQPMENSNVYIRDLIVAHFNKTEGIDTIKVSHEMRIKLPR
jgi:2',3'-cyclic-nucleotide 2'-phosphodiesterase (5'-nucleotidase family)